MHVLHMNNIFFQNLHQLFIKVWIYYKLAFLCLFLYSGETSLKCANGSLKHDLNSYEELKHTVFKQFGLCKVCPPVNPEGGSSETVLCLSF